MRDLFHRLAKAYQNYRSPLQLLAQRMLRTPKVRVTDQATGLRFRCLAGADHMLGETFHQRIYDVPLVAVRPGDLVIDVGANHGFATCWFAWRGAEVWAYEPEPETFSLLQENLRANGLEDRARVTQAAVGDHAGRLTLHRSSTMGGGVSTLDADFARASGAEYRGTVEVEAIAVGEIFKALPPGRRVRLLKLDCEGSELPILAALRPEDRERIDAIAVEVHPQAYSLDRLIELCLGWPGFHLARPAAPESLNTVLHLVHESAIRDWAATTAALAVTSG